MPRRTATPTKQLKNKLSQAAAAQDGLLVLLLADGNAYTKSPRGTRRAVDDQCRMAKECCMHRTRVSAWRSVGAAHC